VAFYIRISKRDESESSAHYVYESDQGRRGVLNLNKVTGEATMTEPMPGDEKRHCFSRAAIKIRREWKERKLPEILEWAS
jgi:hypothetical protein